MRAKKRLPVETEKNHNKMFIRIGINRREEKDKRPDEEMEEEKKTKYSIAMNKQPHKENKQREASYICFFTHLLSKVELTFTNCIECMRFCYSICIWFAKR